MSPYVNRRNDRFGGSINRMRFVLEIVDRIHRNVGRIFLLDFAILEEYIEGGRT